MKGPKTTKTEERTQEATQQGWDPAMQGIQNEVLPGLQRWGQQPLGYTGPSYLNLTGDQLGGRQAGLDYSGGAGQGVVSSAHEAWGQALDPSQFMRAQGAYSPLDTYASQVGRNLREQQLPGIRDQAIGQGQSGGYSSKRMQQEAMAGARASGDIAQYGANLTGSLYGQGINARNAAMAQGGQMYQLGLDPSRTQTALGDLNQGDAYQRQQMGNQMQQFEQMEPYQRMAMLGGQYGSYAPLGQTSSDSSSSTSTQQKERDMLGLAMSLGQMALGAYTGGASSAASGLAGMFGGGGGGGGGGYGGLGGMGGYPGAQMMNPYRPPSYRGF